MYSQRQAHWVRLFSQARKDRNNWVITDRYYTLTTARQIASDIRHHRRVVGISSNEQVEAEYFIGDIEGNYRIAVKML